MKDMHNILLQVCETGPGSGGKVGDCWNNMSGNVQRLSTHGQIHFT